MKQRKKIFKNLRNFEYLKKIIDNHVPQKCFLDKFSNFGRKKKTDDKTDLFLILLAAEANNL